MLQNLLYADWDEPTPDLLFERPYRDILQRARQLLREIQEQRDQALRAPDTMPLDYFGRCLELYLLAPALVNVSLNYKVCVEQGLPLHPTCYFKISDKSRFQSNYSESNLVEAQAFFLDAIATAQALYALAPDAEEKLTLHESHVPKAVFDFVYTSNPDKYTWRASDPRKIRDLAHAIQKFGQPVLLIGAAHGAIMSGILLANMLDIPLYFIRFSMFKREDKAPVISPSDLQFLSKYREGPVVLFDEDIAKGSTMKIFTNFLEPFFKHTVSAGVLRHRHAEFQPDFIGKVWD